MSWKYFGNRGRARGTGGTLLGLGHRLPTARCIPAAHRGSGVGSDVELANGLIEHELLLPQWLEGVLKLQETWLIMLCVRVYL